MVYSQARLEEAIRIIKDDNARLRQEQAEKYARTHYRDDFQLRKGIKASWPLVPFYPDYGSDLDDEDYDPDGKSKGKKASNNHRFDESSVAGKEHDRRKPHVRRSKSKPHKGGQHETGMPSGIASVYVTIKLRSHKSKKILQTLSHRYGMQINTWIKEQSSHEQNLWARSGGSFKRLGSHEEMRQLADQQSTKRSKRLSKLENSCESEEATVPVRRLRSGRIRTSETKKAKKSKNENTGRSKHERDDSDENCQEPTAAYTFIATESSSQQAAIGFGSSYEEAILIDDNDSSDLEDDSDASSIEDFGQHSNDSRPSCRRKEFSEQDFIDLTNEADEEDADAAEVTTITTCYAHPINFKSPRPRCDFCSDYRFGIVGHRNLEVTIARSSCGTITELGNGHAQTHPQTTMCLSCAMDRMMVTRCITHRIRRFDDSFSKSEINAYAADLIRQDPGRCFAHPPKPVKRICSICPMPATFECSSLQKWDKMLNPVQNPLLPQEDQIHAFKARMEDRRKRGLPCNFELKPAIFGCGLALCEKCKVVVERCGGRLIHEDVVAAALARGAKEMVRGDVDFLFRQGDLWKSYNS